MKKVIAFLLVMILILPASVYADGMDQELTKLITVVKEKIEVPAEFTEFRHHLQIQDLKGKENVYSLSWEDKAYKIGSIQAAVEQNGNIVSYAKYLNTKEYSILAKVSYEDGLKTAQSFLNKVAGHYAKELKVQKQTPIGQSNTHEYRFDHYVNNVKIANETVSVYVDKQTGEVTQFYGIPTYKGTYGADKVAITLEEAKENYLSKIGVTLIYNIRYDYETKTVKSFPVYEVNNRNSKAIDAKTGEVITPSIESILFPEAKETTADMAAGVSRNALTPKEQKAVDEVKSLLTKEQAAERAAKYFPKLKSASISSAQLYKSDYDNKYTWQIQMQQVNDEGLKGISAQKIALMRASGEIQKPGEVISMNLSVDAKTGEVLSYYNYGHYDNKESTVSEEVVKTKVEAFLKSIAKDKFAASKYHQADEYRGPIPFDTKNAHKDYYYRRLVNGIPVQGDGLRVTYDAVNDEVISYTNTWHQADFKEVTKIVDKKKIVDGIGLELMYIDKDDQTRVLAYAHREGYMTFDPFTGARVNHYDGKPVSQQERAIYSDIKGHAKEAVIKKLYDSGIYLPGSSFKPDAPITQYDFIRLVLRITDDTITEEELYKRAIERGLLEQKEKNKDSLITKEQAVKYIISSTSYKDIAKLTDIYAYPFEDEKEAAKELKGYITLAYGLKIVEKDKVGQFNPKAQITRADAAQMVYNLLLAGQ